MKSAIFGSGYFLEGFAPMQMLIEMALITGIFGLLARLTERRFRFNKLFQATGLFAIAIVYLKYRVSPPMPFSLLAMYTTIIGIGIFVWVSATDNYWKSFCRPILEVIDGDTRGAKVVRNVAVTVLPIAIALLGFMSFKPDAIEQPLQLRTYHAAPPASIVLHGKTVELQTAQNPFRVYDDGTYMRPPSDDYWEHTCANEFSALRERRLCKDQ